MHQTSSSASWLGVFDEGSATSLEVFFGVWSFVSTFTGCELLDGFGFLTWMTGLIWLCNTCCKQTSMNQSINHGAGQSWLERFNRKRNRIGTMITIMKVGNPRPSIYIRCGLIEWRRLYWHLQLGASNMHLQGLVRKNGGF